MRALALLLVASMTSLVGCAHLPPPPVHPTDEPGFSAPMSLVPEGMDVMPAEEYRLSPGDVITIRTFSAENREHTHLLVDERGLVHIPLAGDVEVGGVSLVEAERRIEQALGTYDRALRAHVIIEAPTGHIATVLGAVAHPGRYPIGPNMYLGDLLAVAGGPRVPTSELDAVWGADLTAAQLVRDGRPLPVSLERAMFGDPRHNIRVRSGDHLYVPAARGRTITVIGEVRAPRIVPYGYGIRLTQAIALAGGLGPDAHRKDIRVVRGDLAAPRVYQTSIRALVDGEGPDVELAPGDIVYVTRTGVANVRDALASIAPILSAAQAVGITFGFYYATRP
ncbi:MAG: SLBB domain-containing protein [Polyangiales bacterium]